MLLPTWIIAIGTAVPALGAVCEWSYRLVKHQLARRPIQEPKVEAQRSDDPVQDGTQV